MAVGNGSERIHCLNSRLIGGACKIGMVSQKALSGEKRGQVWFVWAEEQQRFRQPNLTLVVKLKFS